MAPQSHSPAVKLQQSRAAAMGAHRWSHVASKTAAAPPRKVRIVHVLAPEVIKADVGEFRDVVQRLTGMPDGSGGTMYPSSCEGVAESSRAAGWFPDAATGGGAAMAMAMASANTTTVKAEVKQEVEAEAAAYSSPATSGEEEEGIPDVIDDVFFQELEDFLFSSSSCSHVDGGWH